MKIAAAVLERTGGPLHVAELELAAPGAGEVLVRLHASGVCHSDQNAVDGTAEARCPVVLGHEGAGVVEAIGPAVTRVSVGQHVALSWAPSCGACEECLRELPHLCSEAWPAMGAGGLLDGTSTLLVRRHDGLTWAVLFNRDRDSKGKTFSNLIDPLVHRAADEVKEWPAGWEFKESTP